MGGDAWEPVLVLLGVVVAVIGAVYGLGAWLAVVREPLSTGPFSGGLDPAEHPVSRFHVRGTRSR